MEGNILSPSLLSRNKRGKTLKGVRISTQLELSKIEYLLILCSVTVCLKSGQQLRKNSQHGIKEKKGGNYAGVLMSCFFFYASLRRGWHIREKHPKGTVVRQSFVSSISCLFTSI